MYCATECSKLYGEGPILKIIEMAKERHFGKTEGIGEKQMLNDRDIRCMSIFAC